jgi:23S rRNA (pseudouridine1915-N3)-methyltransferase
VKVHVYVQGKTKESYLRRGEDIYRKRLRHYLPIDFTVLPDIKKGSRMPPWQLREAEGRQLLASCTARDRLILLDEAGRDFTSTGFADYLGQQLQRPERSLIFAVGGAFEFSEEVYDRSDDKIRLSSMTFSHQMVRVFFLEQLYRAMTILKNEKYHNP